MKCPDCGCSMNRGICSNCQEELYIGTFQAEDIDYPISGEFSEKMAEQSAYIEKRDTP